MTDTVYISFFENFAAKSIRVADLTLEELKTRILAASAPKKDKLPWLKLAVFGNKRTVKASLRHDANVLNITGVELDYDGPDDPDAEWIGFDQAVELVRAINIKALVYTSPSHTAANPKWRILAPTSGPLSNEIRAKLVARINGHIGVLITRKESFTLSQAYYYGRSRENKNSNHMVEVLDGDYVDKRTDLKQHEDAGKYQGGKSNAKTSNAFDEFANENAKKDYQQGMHGFTLILTEIGDGPGLKGFNDVLTRAVASYVALHNGNKFDVGKLKTLLREAIESAPKAPNRSPHDLVRYKSDYYLEDIIGTAERKFIRESNKTIDDFVAYLPMHNYIYIPTGQHWPAISINCCLPPVPMVDVKGRPIMKTGKHKNQQKTMKPSDWLDINNAVEQTTWVPDEPQIIRDKVMPAGGGNGWIAHPGAKVYNLYQPPTIIPGNPNAALPWINHIRKVYPDDADHIIYYMAYKVQHPADKINHALVLGGAPGIGKDTLLEPVKKAVGPWNFQEIDPALIFAPFNPFLQAVILRISEARDQGEIGQYKFHDHMKRICASPPDVLRVNAKHVIEYYIPNCCGVIMTTNHRTGALWLPANDRRTYIAWSVLSQADFSANYWKDIWEWLGKGEGCHHVTAYLQTLDLSGFDAKAPPKKTDAFYAVVDAGIPDKEDEIADAVDAIGRPEALTIEQIELAGDPNLQEWLIDIRNNTKIHYRLEAVGYQATPNPHDKSGRWIIMGRRKKVYCRDDLTTSDRFKAAQKLVDDWNAARQPPKNNPIKSTIHPFPGKPKF
jgi:hypothetical protein